MKKFKTLDEEIKWWKKIGQKERDRIIQNEIKKVNKRRLKSELLKMDAYLKSGKVT